MVALTPFALMVSCGGGGGGDGTTTGTGTSTQRLPVSTASAISSVPLAGELLADCADTGIGVVDSVIDGVSSLGVGTLPTSLPNLSDVVSLLDPSKVPVLGGIIVDALGQLDALSSTDALALLPTGLPGLGALPIAGQLPTVCSSLTGVLGPDVLTDPSALLAILGDPTHALGVIAIFDSAGNPVGSLLATVSSGLVPGSTLPGVPELTSLVPVDTTSLGGLATTVTSTAGNLLETLNLNGLLSGGLLGLLPPIV